MRDIIIGGLLLPFKILFQPDSFRREVHELAPDLGDNYSLRDARRYWRNPAFRRGMGRTGKGCYAIMVTIS